MKYEQLWKDIETLCALRGPSGREAAVREYLIEQIKGHAEYEVDPLGNLLVRKRGKNLPKRCCSFPPIWTKWALLSPTLMKRASFPLRR